MNKIQFDRLLKPLIEIYDDIELDLISNILDRIENYKNVKGSLEWYLDKLAELGILENDNLKVLKKNKSKIEKVLKEIVNNVGKYNENLELLTSYYEKGLLNVNPLEIYNSESINNLVNNALKDSKDILELINTKAIEGANQTYKYIINKAYVETASGIYTYTESIRRALNEMAEIGIETVHYKSGRSIGIESAVRRDVITRMNKLVGDVELKHCEELGTNLVYVDQHLGARVRTKYTKNDYEAHAEWQGKKYMIEGSNDKYDNLYEKTGYGEMLGLKGINCYHNMRPTWEWEEIPDIIDEVVNKEKYELYQQQRTYERKIRKLKRKRFISEKTNDSSYENINSEYQEISKEFNTWLKDNGLNRDYFREYVKESNIGLGAIKKNTLENHTPPKLLEKIDIKDEKNIEKTLKYYENQIKDSKIENAIVITSKGDVYQCFGNKTNVWPDVDLGEELLNAYITHNHIKEETYFGFSLNDINLFEKYNLTKLRGVDYKYTYEFDRNRKPILKNPTFDNEEYGFEHIKSIQYAIEHDILYKRWENE